VKNSNNTSVNRILDLPTCSAVPKPTAPPRTLNRVPYILIIQYVSRDLFNVEVCARNVGGVGRGLRVTLFKSFSLELTGYEPRPALKTF
jgi:hypothetical protein